MLLSRALRRVTVLVVVALCATLLAPAIALGVEVVRADAGEWFSIAVLGDGSLWGWGYNSQGQLGDGTLEKHLSPSRVDSGTDWAYASAGYRHVVAVKKDGSLWAWGFNKDGQLGIGHADPTFLPDHWHWRPSQVGSGTAWTQVATGRSHSVALDLNGSIWAWGANDAGQLGTGSTLPTSAPTLVSASPGPGLTWTRVWAEDDYSLALADNGTLWSWGRGTLSPTLIAFTGAFTGYFPGNDANWFTVAPTENYLAVTMADTGLWSWNNTGTLNVEPALCDYEVLDVAGINDPGNAIADTLTLRTDHSLWIYTDSAGTLRPVIKPDGSTAPKRYIIGNALNWQALSAGRNHFLISKSDGSLWGWGKNTFGQLGDGTDNDRISRSQLPSRIVLPTPIPDVRNMTQADAQSRIEEMGFKVGTVTQVATTGVEITRIISQTPAQETLVLPGGTVNIVVSAGPPIPVPNVAGLTETVARATIGAAGLQVGAVTQTYSSIVPEGSVISQSPVAESPVIVNSKVNLVISKGRQPHTIPIVAGKTEAQARSAIQAAGLVVGGVTKEYSTGYKAGLATRTNPAAGTTAYEGDAIQLYISLGKPKATVSNPIAPTTMYTTRYATVWGTLKPAHTVGSYPIRIYKYRYVSGKWVSYGTVSARASAYSGYTKYSVSMRLPYTGKWRLRAYHPEDSQHAATWSSGYDYVTVK